ncbi:type I methionyl aminopeptidase [Flavihumibacter rivuli]|uniref:type I methionyl aminopeptidase n=1 Tax=Flavihumibacter rivuli TaxID=2838156 RepID=UPI001BDEED30|nr:type I methionyl aminopeptidase [Flavihumibacter rivuli]ULQ55870.1 type I methionyl aminopeptidase [Flavihumibacter rivuli]
MSISTTAELLGMQKVSEAVAFTLKEMMRYAAPGMSTKELDDYGGSLLTKLGARSAPNLAYGFPGWSCISVNKEFCHGIPSSKTILQEGDLINIDVSAELNGYWADNGASFVLGTDLHGHSDLVEASRAILRTTLSQIKGGVRIADIGLLMETEAKKKGYKVIKNLGGHGIGRALHEQPDELLNYRNKFDKRRFRKNSVVAIETFISTASSYADTLSDGWTLVGDKGGYMAQHEHTIIITDGAPVLLTEGNGIFN